MQGKKGITIVAAVFMSVAMSTGARASDAPDTQRLQKLNGGYYLLHKLGEDEAQVPLLLDIKTAPKELPPFGDTISRLGKETDALIEGFCEKQPSLRYDRNPLPPIEQDVRDSIKGDKQHQLLFGSKGPEFVRVFINSQLEASTYGLNLCKVLADQEPDHARAAKLRQLGGKWQALRERALAILRDY